MNFSLDHSAILWIVLGSLAALAVAVWAYRFALPPLTTRTRALLWTLRAAAVVVLLLLLGRPLLSIAERSTSRDVIVLEDVSLSMALPAGVSGEEEGEDGDEETRTRAELATEAADELQDRLEGRYRVRRWYFASSAQEAQSDSTPRLDLAATALGDAVQTLSSVSELAGVVVVSDGVANRGRDPVQAARELGASVSAVVVGGPTSWDASLEEVAVNPTARSGQSTPMELRFSHTGDAPRRATITVSDAAGVLTQEEVTLPPGGAEVIERLHFVPRKPGLSYYRIAIDAGPGEAVSDNNVRAVVQQVLPDRQKILFLGPSLNWDLTWFKRSLDADSAWTVSYGIARGNEFRQLPGSPGFSRALSIGPLEEYSVVVLSGLTPNSLPSNLSSRLVSFVRSGGGLVLWGGPAGIEGDLGAWLQHPLGEALGLSIVDQRVPPDVLPELPASGRIHDIVRLDEDLELNRRYFAGLPPLSNVSPIATRPGDQVLVSGAGGSTFLVNLRRAGRGRVLLINGSGLWRWGFSGSDRAAPNRYRRFWAQAIRALAEPTQTEPLRVTTHRPLMARGQDVGITASLQDDSFQPVPGARVEARVVPLGGLDGAPRPEIDSESFDLLDQGDGSYAGVRPALPPGRYALRATARGEGVGTQTAESEFVVDTWSPEVQAIVPDRATLERMAQVSGGAVATTDEVGRLASELATQELTTANWREIRLWENPWVFLFIVGFLGTEWWLRRRRGLP